MVDIVGGAETVRVLLSWMAIPLALALACSLFVVSPAHAISCSGDTWADGDTWDDNYLVGYSSFTTCDLNGEYTVGIQRINWGLGYRQSTVDGYFGSGTQQDVKSYQTLRHTTSDGLVGPATWSLYRNELFASGVDENGTLIFYKTNGYSQSWMKDTGPSPDRWYGRKLGTSSTYVKFWTSGPA
ncbi:MAG: peptidoglycan-binding domain-containing protein [Acidimicrobiia bacterium]